MSTQLNRRGCLFYIKRGLKWFAIILVGLIVLGVSYQTIATEADKRNYAPRGSLYTVNGSQMHMICQGEGSPAVILEAGGFANALWWYRVQDQLSEHTQVCAYDRAGTGWSEPSTAPRDALTIVSELHTLLEVADIPAPYVMVGHSYGAILSRIYAQQYPEQVVGVVLVDSALLIPKQFASQSEYQEWQSSNNILQAVLWGMTRTGLMRLLLNGEFQKWGYPPDIALELTALRAANQVFDTDYAERIPARWALNEASMAAENLGDLPMIVLWATEGLSHFSAEDQQRIAELQAEVAGYSSNSSTRYIEGADHGSIMGNEQYTQQVSQAILDLIAALTL